MLDRYAAYLAIVVLIWVTAKLFLPGKRPSAGDSV
jgi:hypothetical protein